MSGEVDYRTFGGLPSPKPKYLSDSLTPWYGAWSSVTGIAYDDLPPQPGVMARIYVTAGPGDFNSHVFTFNTPQNLTGDLLLEFWYKCSTNDPAIILYLRNPVAYTTGYAQYIMNGDNLAPTVWTKLSLPISTAFTYYKNRSAILPRISLINNYVYNMVAPVTMNYAGFNIRRLP